jgi:hypothetical protein
MMKDRLLSIAGLLRDLFLIWIRHAYTAGCLIIISIIMLFGGDTAFDAFIPMGMLVYYFYQLKKKSDE